MPIGESTTRTSRGNGRTVGHGRRREAVVEQLLSDIFEGRLKAGERLIIQDLSRRMEMSSSPIREALVQLQGIGIIDFVPNCGGVVRAVTRRDVEEVCQVRQALECEAVRNTCGRITLSQLHALAEAFFQMKSAKRHGARFVDKARRLDSQLHDLIAQSCGNRFLAGELERLKILFRAFRDASWEKRLADNDSYRFAEEADEHLAIVNALIDADVEAASQAMARHIQSGARYWSQGLPEDAATGSLRHGLPRHRH